MYLVKFGIGQRHEDRIAVKNMIASRRIRIKHLVKLSEI